MNRVAGTRQFQQPNLYWGSKKQSPHGQQGPEKARRETEARKTKTWGSLPQKNRKFRPKGLKRHGMGYALGKTPDQTKVKKRGEYSLQHKNSLRPGMERKRKSKGRRTIQDQRAGNAIPISKVGG